MRHDALSYFFNGKPMVRPSFCLFADLLGVSHGVRDCNTAEESNTLLQRILDAFESQKSVWNFGERGWMFKLFSDCLVFANPLEDGHALGAKFASPIRTRP